MWAGARYSEADDRPIKARVDAELGGDGIVTRFWGPTAIPRLLELDIGTMGFYYLLHDHPREMRALINTIHAQDLEAFRILAQGPCDVIVLAENTSTFYISPPIYRKYNRPSVQAFVDTVHEAGKVAILHMCGHVKGLMSDFQEIGFDGIHALTPPPTGDTPWELAMDALGDDIVIVGALDPTIWVAGPLAEIPAALDALYTPRLRNANFILCAFADGIPVGLERFKAIAKWMEKNGARSRSSER
jgi:uroporphyrinogen-III decarboxylase